MYSLTKKEFQKLSKSFNLIPIYREIAADIETPVSAFLKLDNNNCSFLLESAEGGEKFGRYSFIGLDPFLTVEAYGQKVTVSGEQNFNRQVSNPLKLVEKLVRLNKQPELPDLPPFSGGAVGYIGYDAIRYFEKIPQQAKKDLNLPDLFFAFTNLLIVFDHLKHKIKVLVNARVNGNASQAYEQAVRKIEATVAKLQQPLIAEPLGGPVDIEIDDQDLNSNMPPQQFKQAVKKARDYIFAGDTLQIVLSQRFAMPTNCSPFAIYRWLRIINPSPYLGYLKFKNLFLVSSSTDPLIKVQNGKVITRPIAGTRRRGLNSNDDLKLEKELLNDKKEKAEHIMLVDLGRNDLGRVCQPGSVKVDALMLVERYSHVMHLVSQVSGRLKPEMTPVDALQAAFPAGTVSGAPKIRAMEIIDELEPTLRGPYAGVFGYLSFTNNLDTGITIRTIVVHNKMAYVQAGAGIVADSDPDKEWQETVNKAKAMLKAVKLAETNGA